MSRYDWNDERHALGVATMDATHREFLELARAIESGPPAEFAARFEELVEHTRAHFAAEEALMRETACPGLREHEADHGRVLGDLGRFLQSVAKGRPAMARAYIASGLSEWFDLHVATMDAQLAAHLNARQHAG